MGYIQFSVKWSCGFLADRCSVAAGWLGAHGLLGASVSQFSVDGGNGEADTEPEVDDVVVRFWQL